LLQGPTIGAVDASSTALADRRRPNLGEWVPVGVLAFLLVVVAVNHSGFSPVAWGWTSLALLLLACAALLLGNGTRVRARELALFGSLVALLTWTLLSAAWSASAAQAALEAERLVVYVAASLAALLLLRSHRPVLVGVWAAVLAVCAYSLATRLFPTRLGVFDSIAGYRLSEPIGYWNGLGLFATMGLLLALGIVLGARGRALRLVAGSSTVVLASTLYFTFSRGAWIALAAGILTLLVLDSRRLRVLAALLVVVPWSAIGIWIASQSEGLTRLRVSLDAAASDGRLVALAVAALSVAAAVATLVFDAVDGKYEARRPVRIAAWTIAALAVLGGFAIVSVREGSPPTLARKAYDAFVTPSPFEGEDLNRHLLRLSAGERIPQWRVAWKQYRLNPWLGSGAGTYETHWLRYRPAPGTVRDAHNLYLETLAELGPVGLGVLCLALLVPLGAAIRARERGLVSAASGAYVAYLVHSAGEWNWELPAITLAALFVGCALLVAARTPEGQGASPMLLRPAAAGAAAVLAVLAFIGLVGNSALEASTEAVQRLELERAESDARKAARWMPWSPEPWQRVAEAQLYRGERSAARQSLRRALAKEDDDWELWYRLALVSSGHEQREALEVASRLNPLDPDVRSLRSLLADAARRPPRG
jgi:O-Antigen ligase